jgi:hypothetical protein
VIAPAIHLAPHLTRDPTPPYSPSLLIILINVRGYREEVK